MTGSQAAHGSGVPEGFTTYPGADPYETGLGPWYYRWEESGGEYPRFIFAIRVEERHANERHVAHGGFLATMCDIALGLSIALTCEPRRPIVTVSLTTNFIASAIPGDWVEARVDINRIGGRLAYVTCALQTGERTIMTASAVFAVMKPVAPRHRQGA